MTENKCRVLILGAKSDIAQATARVFAAHGHPLMLAARDLSRLESLAADLRIRHAATVSLHRFDALDIAEHESFVAGLPALPDVAISMVGILGQQQQSERDPVQASMILRSNFEGPALMLGILANKFAERGSGTLIGVSSVAGDRGRAANYVYGSAKAGFTAFLSGLRNRLARQGVHVITVNPGFVRTRMTEGMQTPKLLTAEPEQVARAIHRAWRKQDDVIYVGPLWRLIMVVIRALPEALFKRLSI
ncbi:SDR family oxidoreductase [Ferrovibrio sp.]|uniref:SDR family oxidoreductase n=1 Tax=Ferrovibrio sp. TaxID=1917215 RepID=UPI003D0F87CF